VNSRNLVALFRFIAVAGAVVVLLLLLRKLLEGAGMNGDKVKALAEAIARAEGFYASGNPLPRRANNPGDVTGADGGGYPTSGVANSAGVLIFQNVADGWDALYKKLTRIASGQSHVYTLDMTIADLAQKYTGGDNAGAWAQNVADALNITTDTTLGEYFA
jgi:hypothetical protein